MPAPPNPYYAVYQTVLAALTPGQTIHIGQLLNSNGLPAKTIETKRRHLRTFIEQNPQYLAHITGFYPSADTIIDLIETRHGKVLEAGLDAANQQCRQIVRGIARPLFEAFVRDELAAWIAGNQVTLPVTDLLTFLLEGFTEFSKGAGNGLVSIAGTLNERLLIRAMANGGMKENTDFVRTGTNSEADLIVHSHTGNKTNLGVEVKSYHARERLLRGLQDINGLKVGVGFFKDASEFNPQRTVTLLQAGPAAIYMPSSTLNNVDPASRTITTNEAIAFGSRVYRPLEQFVTDAKHYNANGNLPLY